MNDYNNKKYMNIKTYCQNLENPIFYISQKNEFINDRYSSELPRFQHDYLIWIFDDLEEAIEVLELLKIDFPKRGKSIYEKENTEFEEGKTAICVIQDSTYKYEY